MLTAICFDAAASDRPGTRLWAVHELAILRDPAGGEALAIALRDPEPLVRQEACLAVEMLAQQHLSHAQVHLDRLIELAASDPDTSVRRRASSAASAIKADGPAR